MQTIALIPLRGGSQSIPRKNVKPMAGRPMCAWAIQAACDCPGIDRVIVSTDAAYIADAVSNMRCRAEIMDRPAELATSTASTESVMLDVAGRIPFDVMVTIQATSPLTRTEHLSAALSRFDRERYDSMLTAVRTKRFFWRDDASPINYDPLSRPRRQDFAGTLMENGAFYITRRGILEAHRCRLGGRIGVFEMPEDTAVEIDEPADWPAVERVLVARTPLAQRARTIKAVVLDVDGTLTDGAMFYGPSGEAMKRFHARDGHGIGLLRAAGFRICVATRENSPTVAARMAKLGITDYLPGAMDKKAMVDGWLAGLGIGWDQTAMMGDDVNDLDCLRASALAACPADAHPSVRAAAHWTSTQAGGCGAVRELADLLLEAGSRPAGGA